MRVIVGAEDCAGIRRVTPVKAGVQGPQAPCRLSWIPAFAGMTNSGRRALA